MYNMGYDEMLEMVDDFENILTDLTIVLNELIDEGETRLNSEAVEKYISVSSRTNLLKGAPCKDVREACAKFDENYDDFLRHNVESVREAVMEFNNALSNADLTEDRGLKPPINIPKEYARSKESTEDEQIYGKVGIMDSFYSIVIKPYEERDYTLKDDEELLDNNYGYTKNNNGIVYRVTRTKNKEKDTETYYVEICITLSDGAYDVICNFTGQSGRVSYFLNSVNKGNIDIVDQEEINNLSSDALEEEAYKVDYDKYIPYHPLSEARKVLKYIVDNN